MKKIICSVLSVCILASSVIPTVFASGKAAEKRQAVEEKHEAYIETVDDTPPLVVVRGMDFNALVKDEGTETEETVGIKLSFSGILGALGRATVIGVKERSFDAFVLSVLDYAYSIMKNYSCDKNGDSAEKITTPTYEENASHYPELCGEGGTGEEALVRTASKRYGADKVYFFAYDWRLDPTVNAKKLDELIEKAIAEHPEYDKVNAVCCSMGGIVTLAYLTYYGSDRINSLCSDSSVMYGTDVASELFTGKINFDGDAAERYLAFVAPKAAGLIHFISRIGLTESVCKIINRFAEKFKTEIYSRVLLPVYGTMPAFWSIVYPDVYPQAREYVFDGIEDEYAGLLAKTDRFQREVVAERTKTLEKAMNNGMKFTVVANYNRPNIPAYKSAPLQGDGTLETGPMSFGATVSVVGSVLTEEQLSGASSELVSADKCINASTAEYSDRTWFVRNCRHVGCIYLSDFSYFIINLIESEEQPLCDTFKGYQRFMIADKEERLYALSLEKIEEIERTAYSGPVC